MKQEKEMRRLSIYIDKDLVNLVQKLAEKEKRSTSFWVANQLEKAVNKKKKAIQS
mgnify:CR=1 FL=1